MEPKPSYLLVGTFVLLMAVIFSGFVVWMYGYRGKEEYVDCVIMTEESVSGVKVGSPVRYKGVDVGKVYKVELHPEDPSVIVIYMRIKKKVPLSQNTIAQILPIGITGLSYISLSGGKGGKPYMVKIGKGFYPVVRLELSGIQKVSRSLPELIAHANELITRMNRLFSDKNIENFTKFSRNMEVASKRLIALEAKLSELTSKLEALSESGNRTAEEFRTLARDARKELKKLTQQLSELTREAQRLVEQLKYDPSVVIYGPAGRGPGEEKR